MVTFNNDTDIVIHRDSPTGPSYGSFVKGEKQVYTEKWVGLGHRWISWLHTNGVRCFAAVSGSESYGVDQWATISAPETKDIELTQEDGVATFIVDGVHKHYDNPSGEIFGQCNSGDEIRYYWKCVTNGHRYVVGKEEIEKSLWRYLRQRTDLRCGQSLLHQKKRRKNRNLLHPKLPNHLHLQRI